MIKNISRITIYVNNQEEAETFWVEKMGFNVVLEQPMGDSRWLEVAPEHAETRFVLYDKQLMKKMNPDVNTAHPSLILSSSHLEQTHKMLKEKGVNIRDIQRLPYGMMCTFFDQDNNPYMLREDK